MKRPETRYARSGDLAIPYQVRPGATLGLIQHGAQARWIQADDSRVAS